MSEVFVRAPRERAHGTAPARCDAVEGLVDGLRTQAVPAGGPPPGTGPAHTAATPQHTAAATTGLPRRAAAHGLAAAPRSHRFVKRLIDIVVSLAGLLLVAPFLLTAALAVKLSSPGPVLYVDWRVGRDGRLFRMYKLRSMYRDAEQRRNGLRTSNEVSGPVFKMRADPRITPVGRVLRKLSIDELPQLANVLAGHMSLVGPRPPLPHEVRTYTPLQLRRLSVRPGLTCTWQVSGRSDVPFEQWILMDLDYIDSWTIGRDLRLLLRTVPAVLSGRGAY